MDSFKTPKLIPCHHSFCYKCLEDYLHSNLRNGRFDCSLCRRSVELPKEGISGFQTNFYIETDYAGKFLCDLCGPKSIASIRCLDCKENLCKSCCQIHERLKATRHHKLSDLATPDRKMKEKIRQRVFCVEHPEEEIKLVCNECHVLMCVLCKAVNHDTHASKTTAEIARDVKKNLEKRINQCTDKLRRLRDTRQKSKELETSINDAQEKDTKAIQQHHSKLLDALNGELIKIKETLNNVYSKLRQENAVFMKYVQDEENNCSVAKQNAQEIIQGSCIEIIKKGPNIGQRIADAISRTDPTFSINMEETIFVTAIIKQSELGSLIGSVRDSTRLIKHVKSGRKSEISPRFCQQQALVPSSSSDNSRECAREELVSSLGVSKLPPEQLSIIKCRLKQILATRRNGLWMTSLPYEYKEKFGIEAPDGLMDLIRHSFEDTCKVELVPNTDRYIVYPVLDEHSKEKDLKIPEQDLLPIGVTMTIYLTYIYSCGYFCVQKENSCIGRISEELDKDCKKKSSPNFHLLKKGQFCAGLYSGDNCWTRAEIIDIKDSEPKIELRFVDYGNVERVLSKDIRWLSEKTAEAPEQCISCSLSGIQPLQNETMWSKASGLAFADIVGDKPLIAVTRMHHDKVCEVELCLLSDPDIGISETLIVQGVVRSIFPEQRDHEEIEKKEVVVFSDPDKIIEVEPCLLSDQAIGISEKSVTQGLVSCIYPEKRYQKEIEKEEVVDVSDPGKICEIERYLVSDSDIIVNEKLIENGVGRCIFPQPPEKGYHEEIKKEEVMDASDSDAVVAYSASSGKEACSNSLAPSAGQFERVLSYYCHDTAHAMETSQSYNTKVEVVNSTSRESSDVFRHLLKRLKSRFMKEVTPVSKDTA